MKKSGSCNFQFHAQELPHKLRLIFQEPRTGEWCFEFPELAGSRISSQWYLSLFQGRVVFSGNQPCGWNALLETFQRYIPRLRDDDTKQAILRMQAQLTDTPLGGPPVESLALLNELSELNLLKTQEVQDSLGLRMLSDLDTYLFDYSGQAYFLPSSQMEAPLPISGFDLETLLSKANERRLLWNKLKILIPSMEKVPVLNTNAVKASSLNGTQRERLELLVSGGRTLNEITVSLAQDSLEIAKLFAKLVADGLVVLRSSGLTDAVEIFVVDDSPILLKQFKSLVASWGYCVRSFCEPSVALQALIGANPAVIFLDINMPNVTGFDLVKQIRRLPGLEDVPVIMLTAEKSLSNNWRARWSGCQFMSKPLTPGEIPTFRLELRALLAELAPLHQSTQSSRRPSEFQMKTSY